MNRATNVPGPGVDSAELHARLGEVGRELAEAFRRLLDAIPDGPLAPTTLARRLGLSRVLVGKLVGAVARSDPYEVLDHVPGPESLRSIARGVGELGVPSALVRAADSAADQFAALIREEFGTRGAFRAVVTARSPELQRRFELASRYHVFLGMRQLLGVEAETWLTSMIFVPTPGDDEHLATTTLHGALAMRRLRPDVEVHFTFGPPPQVAAEQHDVSSRPIDLREFYSHPPAPVESQVVGGQLVHRLANRRFGRRAMVDMLAVGHDARGSRRYATPQRPRGGLVVFPDIPVKTLIVDALLHDEAFPAAQPELLVYNPGIRGPANPADRHRDIDRIAVPETIEALGKSDQRFVLPEVPHYGAMVERVCQRVAADPARLRVFRLRMAYPIPGFQVVLAFNAPQRAPIPS